jgi:hypothetical protein
METVLVLLVVSFVVLGRALEVVGVWIDERTRETMRYPKGRK